MFKLQRQSRGASRARELKLLSLCQTVVRAPNSHRRVEVRVELWVELQKIVHEKTEVQVVPG